MPNTEPVRVTIFNQTYSLVASEEPGRIEHLAQKVDDLMSSIAVRAGNIDATRAAVLACLHLADELESLERRLASLKDNVDHQAQQVHHIAGRGDERSSQSRTSKSAPACADYRTTRHWRSKKRAGIACRPVRRSYSGDIRR